MQYRIEEKHGIRYLYTGESATQSAIQLNQPHKIILKNLEYALGCLMFIAPPKNILILGVAGGSLIHFFRHYCPQAQITGIDIDAELMHTMQYEFLLPQADSLLSYHISDAQTWVKTDHAHYDLIIVDLFNENDMPAWVIEKTFIQDLKQRLTPQGCVTWNTLIESEEKFNHFYQHLRTVFQQRTLCLAAEDYENTIAYSFNNNLKQTDMEYLLQLAQYKKQNYDLPFHTILQVIFHTNPVNSGYI